MMRALLAVLGLLWALLGAGAAAAETAGPQVCRMGARVMQVYGLDPKNDSFSADLWLWSRCPEREEAISPLAALDFPEALRVTPGHLSKRVEDGWIYEQRRFSAVVRHEWTMRDFPFDEHRLSILVESAEHPRDELILEPEAEGSGLEEGALSSVWRGGGFGFAQAPEAGAAGAAAYSGLEIAFDVRRVSSVAFLKFLLGLDVVVLVCLLGLFFDVNNPGLFGSRMSLMMAGLLAVLVNLRGVDAALGETPELTRVAALHLAGMAVILAVAVLSVMDRRRADAGAPAPHPRKGAALALFGVFALAHLGLIGAAADWF